MKSSTTNEVLIEDNGRPVLHKSVMTPDELYLKVNNDKLQFKHQMSDAFVDLSTILDLPEIVQDTGTSTDKVMSQKAVTDVINENVSRIDGDIVSLGTTKADASAVINKTDIVHKTGTANDKVMSQNTTTYNLNLKVDKTAIVQTTGNATDKIMSQDAVTKALAASGTDINVVQSTGTSQTDVMSQKAVTDQVNLKLDKTALAPSTGNGTDVTMTQKAITEFVNSSVNSVSTTLTRFERDIEDNTVNIANHSTFIDQLAVSNSTLVDDVTALKANKADKTSVLLKADIAQGTGNSTTKVMSQKAVHDAVDTVDTKVTNLTNVVNRIDTDLEKSKTDIVAVTNTATRNETRIGNLDTEIQKINTALLTRKDVLNIIYPVGSFYISSVATSPASIVGGTWEQIQGKFLLAVDDTHAAGTTGGESTHILSTNEMPIHNHSLEYKLHAGWNGTSYTSGSKDTGSSTRTWTASSPTSSDGNFRILNTGGGVAHNNMPPYLAVYIWKRTA